MSAGLSIVPLGHQLDLGLGTVRAVKLVAPKHLVGRDCQGEGQGVALRCVATPSPYPWGL
jgi:hypothetical protein